MKGWKIFHANTKKNQKTGIISENWTLREEILLNRKKNIS